jgi:hypothetical protein
MADHLRQCEQEQQAAQAALQAAQSMPPGSERISALRRAGQMRFDADKKMKAQEDVTRSA